MYEARNLLDNSGHLTGKPAKAFQTLNGQATLPLAQAKNVCFLQRAQAKALRPSVSCCVSLRRAGGQFRSHTGVCFSAQCVMPEAYRTSG